jgi:5-methylcytosine-specific restriction endonuclease McrA
MRRRRTREQAEAILAAHDHLCGLCRMPIVTPRDSWHFDHIIPLADGGTDDDANLHPVHAKCHLAKTKADIARIAKGKRIKERLHGERRRSSFRGWRRFDGTPVENPRWRGR